MRRALALLLVQALIAMSAAVSSLHTHAYDDHDHSEHHHGPSAHEHRDSGSERGDGPASVKGCDPASHTVPFAFVCAAPHQQHAVGAHLTLGTLATPDRRVAPAVRHTELRVHGPPVVAHPSLRAPPTIIHT